MAWSDWKASRSKGNTVDLFEFTTGENPGDVVRYCNGERAVVFDGETFNPIAIERDAIKSKGREMGGNFRIRMPRSCEIAQLFQGTLPRRVIFLRIFEGDIPEFDAPGSWDAADPPVANLMWTGRVLEAKSSEATTTLSCDNLGAGMRRPGLYRFYQRECPHTLFGTRCGASKAAATTSLTVFASDPSGRRIGVDWTATGMTSDQIDNHIGGLLEFTGPNGLESRTIVSTGSTWIDVDSPVTGLIFEDDPFDITLGCQRTMEACRLLHDNILNYGGMPFIPIHNPNNKNNHT